MTAFLFFVFLAAIIIVPQYLRDRDRARVHETLRLAFEKGQPVPPELIDALRAGRRETTPELVEALRTRGGAPGEAAARPAYGPAAYPVEDRPRRDLRRGVIWLAVGLGLVGVGGAFYGGLYNVGGAQETLGTFAAMGSIPAFVGLAYLGLWYFGRNRTRT